jgi:hypothetical protein
VDRRRGKIQDPDRLARLKAQLAANREKACQRRSEKAKLRRQLKAAEKWHAETAKRELVERYLRETQPRSPQ